MSLLFYHIRDLRRIRQYIALSLAKPVATALLIIKLDYCNSILYITANKDIAKCQRVQNCLAWVDTRSPCCFSRSEPLLKSLHWLPVHYRIIFKSCTITYQTLSSTQLAYLDSILLTCNSKVEDALFVVATRRLHLRPHCARHASEDILNKERLELGASEHRVILARTVVEQ